VLTRREFSKSLLVGGTALLAPSNPSSASQASSAGRSPLSPAPSSDPDCDLLIQGGTVIDPAQHLHAELDVAVKEGKILEVSANFPEDRARKVISAKGRIVTPGLIDVHVHIYEGVGSLGVNPDHYCLARGVTTAVDSGSAGGFTIAGFRKYVVNGSATRVYSSLDSCAIGAIIVREDLEWMDPELATRAALENKPVVVGITARVPRKDAGENDLEILRRARQAAEAAGLPLTVHIGDSYSPLKDILGIMRRGDVVGHCYHYGAHGLLDSDGKVLPEVREARARGILFSVAHDARRFSFKVAQKCLEQDLPPDAISSCISAPGTNGPVFDLPTTLSKFLLLGMSLDKVIELATIKPARMFNFASEPGSLGPGHAADVAIFELRDGAFAFEGAPGEKRTGRQKLVSTATIRGGDVYVNESAA
jgi:dihydroorotase